MKRRCFVLIFAILVSQLIFAQDARILDFKLKNDIPVYIMPNTANRVDYFCIVVEGGIFYLDEAHSGLEDALFKMMTCGSEKADKDFRQSFSYRTGAGFAANAGPLNAILGLSAIDIYMEEGIDLVLDSFLNPTFPQKEFDQRINDYKSALQSKFNNPTEMAYYFAEQAILQNHPYKVKSSPTLESLPNITLDEVKSLHKRELDSRRIFVVAITKLEPEKLVQKLDSTLGNLGPQNYPLAQIEVPPVTQMPSEPLELTHPSCGDASYVMRAVPSVPSIDDDYMAMVLAENVYSQIMYSVIRAKYGACYTPYATNIGSRANVSFEAIYRCSDLENIKTYMAESREIMSQGKIIASTLPNGDFVFDDLDSWLDSYKSSLINSTYRNQETTAGHASRIIQGLIQYKNPYALDSRAEKIRSVTVDDILRVFKKYYMESPEFWITVTK